jgi:hypothetical protein
MRWAFIPKNDAATAIGLTIPSALGQKIDNPSEAPQFSILFGNNVREIFDSARQMGDLFFECLCHTCHLRDLRARIKRLFLPRVSARANSHVAPRRSGG